MREPAKPAGSGPLPGTLTWRFAPVLSRFAGEEDLLAISPLA
jgi:hypothetical protein